MPSFCPLLLGGLAEVEMYLLLLVRHMQGLRRTAFVHPKSKAARPRQNRWGLLHSYLVQ